MYIQISKMIPGMKIMIFFDKIVHRAIPANGIAMAPLVPDMINQYRAEKATRKK